MSIFSEKINGMLADILYEDGYRNEEVALELADKDPSQTPALDNSLLLGKGCSFTERDAEAMNKEGLDLGVIKEALAFPYISKKQPDENWNLLYNNDASGTETTIPDDTWRAGLVSMNDVGEIVFEDLGQLTSTALSQYLDVDQGHSLRQHLSGGYCAYVVAKNKKAYWIDVPSYFLFLLWAKEQSAYRQQVARWDLLSATIDHAKKFNEALEQQRILAGLPFKWNVGKYNIDEKSAEAEVKAGNLTYNQYHDTHLIVGELYLGDDYHLMTNDILCMGDNNELIITNSNDSLQYECQVNGLVLKRVPHKITCRQCWAHINNALKG